MKNWHLSSQLKLGISVLCTVIMTLLIITVSVNIKSTLISNSELEQQNKVKLMVSQLNAAYKEILKNTDMLASVFGELYPESIEISTTKSLKIGDFDSVVASHAGEVINLNNSLVDKFSRMTGGTATVFIKHDDDFIRVATSLRKANGSRALGTLLGKQHPAYQKIISGQSFVGEAYLFGSRYMAKYTPVKDRTGQIVAILYIGLPIDTVMDNVLSQLNSVKVGENGYVGMVSTSHTRMGVLLAHKNAPGQSINQVYRSPAMHQIVESTNGIIEIDEAEEFGAARVVYEKVPTAPWTVFALNYEQEYIEKVNELLVLLAALAIIAVVILVALTGMFLNRALSPLRDITNSLVLIGQGDLRCQFVSDASNETRNEIEKLKQSLNEMMNGFRQTIALVHSSGSALSEAAGQVSQSSQIMLLEANRSNDETQEVAAAIGQVAASIEHVAANAAQVSVDANEVSDLSTLGSGLVNEVGVSVRRLHHDFISSIEHLERLSQDTNEIGKVVDVINGIAEQTNLLALNAAIEAARAGEQGRGFAVVADEVRGLAQRTQVSTVEIQQVVEKLQASSEVLTTKMAQSQELVEQSSERSQQANYMLSNITSTAELVHRRIDEIASASEEQSQAVNQLNDSCNRLKSAAVNTATKASGNVDSSDVVEQQSTELGQQVNKFKIA